MNRIIRAGEQALVHARNHRNGGPFRWKVPTAAEIKALRGRLQMTQLQFSRAFAIEVETLKSWEADKKKPSQSSALILALIERDSEGMQSAVNEIIAQQSIEDERNKYTAHNEPEFA